MLSYWETDLFSHSFDCIVLGGGFNGLNVARLFKQRSPKARVLVVDSGIGLQGASTKNAGFACYGSPSELLSDIQLMGADKALELLRQRKAGIDAIEAFCQETTIYQASPAVELFLPENEGLYQNCLEHLADLNRQIHSVIDLPNSYHVLKQPAVDTAIGAIGMLGEGQVHPAQLHNVLECLNQQLGVQFCRAKAIAYQAHDGTGVRVQLDNGLELKGEWLVNCVNGFDTSLNPTSSVASARAQVLLTSELEKQPYIGNYHMDEGYYYFRNVGNRLLLGGGRNMDPETETTDKIELNEKIQERLKQVLREVLLPDQQFEISHQWAGIMGMRSDKSPKIEQLGNCLSAVGMSGMGVALSFYLPQQVVARIC